MTLSPWAPEYRRLSAGIVSLVAVFGFEGIAVSAVMPVAAADLNAISNYAVAFTSFTMASLLGVTFAGLWADHIGVKKIVTLAIFTLGIGSLIAGFAPNMQVLTLGRSVQGFALGIEDHYMSAIWIVFLQTPHHIDHAFYSTGWLAFAVGQGW